MFFLTVEERVLVLHRDEFSPLIEDGNVLQLGELPGPHGGSPDVSDSVIFFVH